MGQTLSRTLAHHAAQRPDHASLILIESDGQETVITAGEFYKQSLQAAYALQKMGIAQGDLVVLVQEHSAQLLSNFWGAMLIGAIPSIFPFLTEKLDPDLYMGRVKSLVSSEAVRAVITTSTLEPGLTALLDDTGCQVIVSEEIMLGDPPEDFAPDEGAVENIAFLQHSSGTTGLQKGVALSHLSVHNQLDAYADSIALTSEDVIVSWLPLYHDMGLIAGFIMPLVKGNTLVLMSPFHWVRDPKILFETAVRHGGTLCWLPNFAYNHCVRSIRKRDLQALDLSGLRLLINCSEPAYDDSHQQFVDKFGPYGFREEALSVCYAMAENTFAVTQTRPGERAPVDTVDRAALQEERRALPRPTGTADTLQVVSCGYPIAGCEVGIVDADGGILADRHVGEIVLRSNSMLSEYYAHPKITAEAIIEGWYYTGDMGYLAEGQLYISGRKKDLIIMAGKNVYPQDLEAIANTIPGIYPGRAVAFGISDGRQGTEAIVMVCELKDLSASEEQQADIARRLRLAIVSQTEVTLRDIRLVAQRWLIKTSSGKIARNDNREKYQQEFKK